MRTIADTIKDQIGLGALMSLGATGLTEDCNGRALTFTARILPFRKDGTRGTQPRKMHVCVHLDGDDTYSVSVTTPNLTAHMPKRTGIYCDQLARLMLALDYDGPEVLNPRIWG